MVIRAKSLSARFSRESDSRGKPIRIGSLERLGTICQNTLSGLKTLLQIKRSRPRYFGRYRVGPVQCTGWSREREGQVRYNTVFSDMDPGRGIGHGRDPGGSIDGKGGSRGRPEAASYPSKMQVLKA